MRLLRVRLPDRPGGLARLALHLAAHDVDILRLEVLARGDDAVDDLLVSGANLDEALTTMPAEVQVVALRDRDELPDSGLAMAEACTAIVAAGELGRARRALVEAALDLADADAGVLVRDAGHEWLRPVAASVEALPPIRGEPSIAGRALACGRPLVASGDEGWAPPLYCSRLGGGSVLAVPGGMPAYVCLVIVRHDGFPFEQAEIDRLQALVRVGAGIFGALGDRPVRPPEMPAVSVRVRGGG